MTFFELFVCALWWPLLSAAYLWFSRHFRVVGIGSYLLGIMAYLAILSILSGGSPMQASTPILNSYVAGFLVCAVQCFTSPALFNLDWGDDGPTFATQMKRVRWIAAGYVGVSVGALLLTQI